MGERNWPDYPRAGFPRLACPLFPLASFCIQKNSRMKPTPLQILALHPPARGSRRLRENIPPNMIRRFLDGEARAWKHSTLSGALWETGVRASRAIATAEKFFSAPQNKSCADSAHATNSPCRQHGGTVPAEPGKPLETEKMKIIDIIKNCPSGVMAYTKGSGSSDPSSDNEVLWVDQPEIQELTVTPELHAEVIDYLLQLDPHRDAGSIGDYRVFDVTDYPEINVDQVCIWHVVVWP